jgi:hypothetical protein
MAARSMQAVADSPNRKTSSSSAYGYQGSNLIKGRLRAGRWARSTALGLGIEMQRLDQRGLCPSQFAAKAKKWIVVWLRASCL